MDYGRFPSDDLGTIMSTSVFKYVLLIDTHLLLNPLLTWSADFSPLNITLFFASLQISASLFAEFLDYLSTVCSRSRWDVKLTGGSGILISDPTRSLCLLFFHSELCLCFMLGILTILF